MPTLSGRFAGKRVLVTGGTSGIGLAGARRVVAEGGRVVVTGRDPDRLERVRAALPDALVVRDDAADPEAGDRLEAALHEDGGGGLDGLWLNAGYADMPAGEKLGADFVDRMFAANVRGPILQFDRLAGRLNFGASVVLTSSTSAYEGAAMAGVYAATKGALVSLARCWASALADRGIRVNALVPGAIDSDFRSFMDDATRGAFEADVTARTPLARLGTPEEAAAVALFLLSDDAAYVTSGQYAVDGGLTKR